MTVVNVHEAKTHLSRLLDAAVSGEEIIIAKDGEPFVVLTPVLTKARTPGAARCRTTVETVPINVVSGGHQGANSGGGGSL